MEVETRFRSLYEAFNARDVDATLAGTSKDVNWPNGWHGGRELGRDAVREYWRRQWAEIDPDVEPISVSIRSDGRVVVDVHQVVRSLQGEVLSDDRVRHVYEMRDDLIIRMDIEQAP